MFTFDILKLFSWTRKDRIYFLLIDMYLSSQLYNQFNKCKF